MVVLNDLYCREPKPNVWLIEPALFKYTTCGIYRAHKSRTQRLCMNLLEYGDGSHTGVYKGSRFKSAGAGFSAFNSSHAHQRQISVMRRLFGAVRRKEVGKATPSIDRATSCFLLQITSIELLMLALGTGIPTIHATSSGERFNFSRYLFSCCGHHLQLT